MQRADYSGRLCSKMEFSVKREMIRKGEAKKRQALSLSFTHTHVLHENLNSSSKLRKVIMEFTTSYYI